MTVPDRHTTGRWTWWLVVLLLGACAGYAGLRGLEAARSDDAPNGWTRVGPKVPFRRAGAAADTPPLAGAWNLDHYESLWGDERYEELEVTAVVPEGTMLRILACSLRKEGLEGPGVVLDRTTDPPSARGIRLTPRAQTNLKCEGELPPPGDAPYAVTLIPGEKAQFEIRVGDASSTCRGAVPRDGPAIVGGLRRTHVLSVAANGDHQAPSLSPVLVPLGLALSGLAWAALCAFEVRLGLSAAGTVLSSLPLLLCVPLALRDPARVADTLQVVDLSTPWLALIAGLGPALAWKALALAGHFGQATRGPEPLPRTLEAWGLAFGPVLPAAIALALVGDPDGRVVTLGLALLAMVIAGGFVLGVLRRGMGFDGPSALRGTAVLLGVFAGSLVIAWALGASDRAGAVHFALAGACLGLLSWARRNFGGWGVGVYAAVLLTLAAALAEGGVRRTAVSERWTGDPSTSLGQGIQEPYGRFAALEAGRHSQVPRTGYPVAFPPRGDATRWVFFGASEVAGGPWADALADYFPAKLGALAGPSVEVLNQGVGDWTTFEMQRYYADRAAALAADLVVVYSGHTDLAGKLPVTLAELHAHWEQAGSGAGTHWTDRLRLVHGLHALVTALIDPERVSNVPVGHAAENLGGIASVAREHGARVLLVKQGLAAGREDLADYHTMIDDVAAAQDQVEVFDAAALLAEAGSGHFIDDRHLSGTGSALLASALRDHLEALGWLPVAEAEPAEPPP